MTCPSKDSIRFNRPCLSTCPFGSRTLMWQRKDEKIMYLFSV